MKRLYICCRKEQREKLEQQAQRLYQDKYVITSELGEADFMVVIGVINNEEMSSQVVEATERKIPFTTVSNGFQSPTVVSQILDNTFMVEEGMKRNEHDRDKEYGFEL